MHSDPAQQNWVTTAASQQGWKSTQAPTKFSSTSPDGVKGGVASFWQYELSVKPFSDIQHLPGEVKLSQDYVGLQVRTQKHRILLVFA